jgi:hypothetical protein
MLDKKPPRIVVHQNPTATPTKGFLTVLWETIEQICFAVGSLVAWPITYTITRLHREPQVRTPQLSIWARLNAAITRASTKQSLTTLGAISLIVIILFATANVSAIGLMVKGRVLGSATTGLEALTAASTALEQNNITAGTSKLTEAYSAFIEAQTTIANSNLALQSLIALIPAARDGDSVLTATTLLTKAGLTASETAARANTITITAQGVSGPSGNAEVLAIINNMHSIVADVHEASRLLTNVDDNNIPEQYREQLKAVRNALTNLDGQLQTVDHIASFLELVLTGNQHILVLLQNNNELRASGGFIGTIGALTLVNGIITKTDIRSVYDYDGQLLNYFRPPSPIVAVNNRLFLRDSNWFTDFPSSAQVVTRFFEREGGETPSVIVAVTPDTIAALLALTGPITIGASTITADNITELLQTQTSLNYDKTTNNPKQFLADAFPVLLQKLGSLRGAGLIPLWSALENSFQSKHLLITSNIPAIEQHLAALRWNGALQQTDRDFLVLSSSNLGGTKTDQFLTKQYNLETTIDADGRIINTVTLTVTNPLPKDTGLTNTSFWRIYTPRGSKLLSSQGFDALTLPRLDDKRYIEDSSIATWNQNTSIDNNSGTFISQEGNSTAFGNWLVVGGGESKTASITYTLPFTLKHIDRYSLLWQKQPGSKQEQYSITLRNDDHTVLWHSQAWPQNQIPLTGELNQDVWYGIVLKQP